MISPIDRRHVCMAAGDVSLPDAVHAEDTVSQSAAVHTPQVRKSIASKNLTAASHMLENNGLRYAGVWRADRSAVLEFESKMTMWAVRGLMASVEHVGARSAAT